MSVAEQLKMPWLQVARLADSVRSDRSDRAAAAALFDTIDTASAAAFRLIDGYILGAQAQFGQTAFELEPVSISSVLYDVAHQLDGFAKQRGVTLELHVGGHYGPVMAHRRVIDSAFANIGYCMIDEAGTGGKSIVRVAATRSSAGITAGMYGFERAFSRALLRRARSLYGYARQPFNGAMAGTGAGVFVADTLLTQVNAPLRVTTHRAASGLAATFMPSLQLRLV